MRVAWALVPMMLFAGCLSGSDGSQPDAPTSHLDWAPLSAATHSLGEFLSLRVPSYDGTILHVDVQLPDGDGPWPLVLEYTPYSILGAETWAIQNDFGMAGPGFYVERGYAFGVAHVRGTGQSEGCLTVGGPDEGLDGAALVQALAAMDWSNGKIGMRGASYVGTTPLETAVHNPPALAAIAPVAAVTEWYKYYFENGEPRLLGGQSGADSGFWLGIGVTPGLRTGTVDMTDALCPTEMAMNQLGQDDYNSYWKARDHGADAHNITVPTLFVQGWDDTNVPPSMIPSAWPKIAGEKRAWLTQQGHSYPKPTLRYMEYELRWFDHYLKGLDNGALSLPNVIIEHDDGTVRAEQTWPPADVEWLRLWLQDGALTLEAPDNGTATYVDAPALAADAGFDELAFSVTVPDGFIIAGDPRVHLAATVDRLDTQFAVYLFADGEESTRGHLDARHRNSLEVGEDVVPGERTAYVFHLRTIDDVVPPGSEMRVVVRSTDPDVYPDATPGGTHTIHFGPEGSWIDLPIVPLRETAASMEALAPALFPPQT